MSTFTSTTSTTNQFLSARPPHLRARTSPVTSGLHRLLTKQEVVNSQRHRPPGQSGPQFLCTISELPEWQQDNAYILTGHRPACHSYSACFQSLFYLHNESVNIHSHLLGCFLFFSIAISLYSFEKSAQAPMNLTDIMVFGCFFLGAVFCLGMSATYHTISCHSPAVARWGNQLDYLGIVGLIVGSFIPSVHYGFYCNPILQKLYWGMVSSLLWPQLSLFAFSQSLNCSSFPFSTIHVRQSLADMAFSSDRIYRSGLRLRNADTSIPQTRLPALPSGYVRRHGLERCTTYLAWVVRLRL